MRILRLISTGVLLSASLGAARLQAQTVCDFEALSEGALPAGYCGINWGTYPDVWTLYNFPNNNPNFPALVYNAKSGVGRVFNEWYFPSFSFQTDAVFHGAWFSGVQSLSYTLFLNGVLVSSSGVSPVTTTPVFIASGYAGFVDSVVVTPETPYAFAMDDLSYTSSVVPEPSALVLLTTGFLGLAAVHVIRRRRRPVRS